MNILLLVNFFRLTGVSKEMDLFAVPIRILVLSKTDKFIIWYGRKFVKGSKIVTGESEVGFPS
jgi:hypothetical protein